MKKVFYCVLISWLSYSCGPKIESFDAPMINIDLNKKTNIPLFQKFQNSIESIILETNKDCLVASVDQFCKDDSILFILDRKQNKIFLFSTSGKFLTQINKQGRGPGEYVKATTFGVNKQKDIIYLYDISQRKLLKFNYNGGFLEEHYNNDYVTSFYRNLCVSNVGNLLMANPDYCEPTLDGVWESDENGKFLRRFSHIKKEHDFKWLVFPYFSQFDNITSYYNTFTDNVFTFKDKKPHCVLQVNMKQRLPNRYLKNNKGFGINGDTGPYFLHSEIAETEKFFFFAYLSNEEGKIFVLYDKDTQETVISKNLFKDHNIWRYESSGIFSYTSNAFMAVDFEESEDKNPELKIIYTN
ncbi:MAG TPA: 6-bladed beta-propeller [Edaphocola sp.]|nr:6-bladed beta-propeller [Edaphocola sp.]